MGKTKMLWHVSGAEGAASEMGSSRVPVSQRGAEGAEYAGFGERSEPKPAQRASEREARASEKVFISIRKNI